jgi:hypothetical protein
MWGSGDEGKQAGWTEGGLPERVFWDDSGQNRRFWLRTLEVTKKDVAVL